MTWTAQQVDVGRVHILPDDDLIAHEESDDCVCSPGSELVLGAVDGSDSWLTIHHSLDGREANE